MNEAVVLLRNAISASDIKSVAMVDDAFDVPSIDKAVLLNYLEKQTAIQAEISVEKETWNNAIADLKKNEEDSIHVSEVTEQLYKKYIASAESQFDPGESFKKDRETNLDFVRPILKFFQSCESIQLKTYGSEEITVSDKHLPDLILVDLFLNPNISSTELPEKTAGDAAVADSVQRVSALLTNKPAIILMSSHGESGRERAEKYRSDLSGKVYASRFGFVDKGQIKTDATGFIIENDARDTLVDIFQTFKFGKALTEAINRWLAGTKLAVDEIQKDILSLELREMAYLVQFRLSAEGQNLEEYLEWFFGEALLDYIIRAIEDIPVGKLLEEDLNIASVQSIDGAFSPTQDIAKMYHRVRIEDIRKLTRKNFRLGDIYYNNNDKEVVAVMTPDCDLILRGPKNKEVRTAEHLLLVRGKVTEIEESFASLGDFIIINKKPRNIEWKYSKVFSLPFNGTFEKAGQSGADYKYLGTLRPLYAQEIQAHLLSHIGRVGVAVPPAIGMPAMATITLRTGTGSKNINSTDISYKCNLIPGRSRSNASRIVFDRGVISQIKLAFNELSTTDLLPENIQKANDVIANKAAAIEKALKSGPELGKEICFGIALLKEGEKSTNWAVIHISQIPDETEVVEKAQLNPEDKNIEETSKTVLAKPTPTLQVETVPPHSGVA